MSLIIQCSCPGRCGAHLDPETAKRMERWAALTRLAVEVLQYHDDKHCPDYQKPPRAAARCYYRMCRLAAEATGDTFADPTPGQPGETTA